MNKSNLQDLFDQLRELHTEEEEILGQIEEMILEENEDYYESEDDE